MVKTDQTNATSSGPAIAVRGARQNNLKNVDVDIPHNRLVVVTGPSGSGKSSLAIQTIFAEGQRQYIETLSTYARQFVSELPRPDFDSIDGLQPTLCIDQHPSNNSPRSTVGTVTEIHDFLRVLMARAADIHCHECGQPIRQMPSDRIIQWVLALPEGTKAMIMAPLVRGRKGKHEEVFEQIRKAGLLRARVDGQMLEVDSPVKLNARQNHSIEAVTDRIIVREGNDDRISESIELALELSGGSCLVRYQNAASESADDEWLENIFSTQYACPDCDVAYAELEPKNFSFNSPYGACQECDGLGWTEQFDPDMILDHSRPINKGGVVPWQSLASTTRRKRNDQLSAFFANEKVTKETLLQDYPPKVLARLLKGHKQHPGLLTLLEQEFATCTKKERFDELDSFRAMVVCPGCDASRLGPQARSASISGQTIIDINRAALDDLKQFFDTLEMPEDRLDVAGPLLSEISSRIGFLCQVGLEYLTLDRPADSLSGGEYQRVRLASSIGNGLANVCYVLDEPTIGLHPADNKRLIQSIVDLKQAGNTVVVVEHDDEMMKTADWIVDIGPNAGAAGGQLMFAGNYTEFLQCKSSTTAQYLTREKTIQRPSAIREPSSESIRLVSASANNLQNVTVEIPLQRFVCVTGVSGSGKSTLIEDTLAPALRRHLGLVAPRPGEHKRIEINGQLENLVRIDQRPIGRSARSNAATYTGVMEMIRKLFAATRVAKSRGYLASRFSFNSKSGKCSGCDGYGQRKIEMNFLPDMYAPCEQCQGRRYNHQTLEVRYRDYSIADVLDMSINTACQFFENVQRILVPLTAMQTVGLGYLKLGQASTTLSGGEAQRIKLATELSRKQQGGCLYLVDEPTTGLHFDDVQKLLIALDQLVDKGNSVVVIEHHMGLVSAADWVIDLGPAGGAAGGRIVATGTPETLAQNEESRTGKFLAEVLG